MKVDVYDPKLDDYIEMDLLGKYRYLGCVNNIDLIEGYIYDRVGTNDEFRIVNDDMEAYLYPENHFEFVSSDYIPCPNCNSNLVDILYGMPSSETFEQEKRKKLYLGGCEVFGDREQPAYHCYNCNRDYYRDLIDYEENDDNHTL